METGKATNKSLWGDFGALAVAGLGVVASYLGLKALQDRDRRDAYRYGTGALLWFFDGLRKIHEGNFVEARLCLGVSEDYANDAISFMPGICDVTLHPPQGLQILEGSYYRVRTLEQARQARLALQREIDKLDQVLEEGAKCTLCGNVTEQTFTTPEGEADDVRGSPCCENCMALACAEAAASASATDTVDAVLAAKLRKTAATAPPDPLPK